LASRVSIFREFRFIARRTFTQNGQASYWYRASLLVDGRLSVNIPLDAPGSEKPVEQQDELAE
jgi:hypothetical protein